MIVLVTIFLIVASLAEILMVSRLTSQQTMESGSNRIEAIGGQLEQTINEAKIQTQQLAIDCQSYMDDRGKLVNFILARREYNKHATNGICYNTYIAGDDWYYIPELRNTENFDPVERSWYSGALKNGGKPFVTDPYVDLVTGEICYTVSVVMPDQETVVAVDYTMESIQQHIRNVNADSDRKAIIVTAEGTIAGCSTESLIGKNLMHELPDYAGIFTLAKSSNSVVHYRRGTENLFATRSGFGWYLIVSENSWSMYKTSFLQMLLMLAISLFIFGVVIVMYVSSVRAEKRAKEAMESKEYFLDQITRDLQEPLKRILTNSSPEFLEHATDPELSFDAIHDAGTLLSERIGKIRSYSTITRNSNDGSAHKRSEDEVRRGRILRTMILGAMLLVMGLNLFINVSSTIRYCQGMMNKELTMYKYRVDVWVSSHKSILDMFSSMVSANPDMLADYDGTIAYLNNVTKQYQEISVTYFASADSEHQVYMSNGWQPGSDINVAEREWYKDALLSDEGWCITSPYYDAQTGLYCITFSECVYDPDTEEMLGVFGIDFYMDKLIEILGGSYSEKSYAFLTDEKGTIINHPYGKYQMTDEGSKNVMELPYNVAVKDGSTVKLIRDYNQKIRGLTAMPTNTSGFCIYMSADWVSLAGKVLITSVCSFIAIIICTFLVYRLLSGMIQLGEEANRKFRESADAAIAADAAKSNFLAQMSHEIRTPINAVLGMNEMILRESTSASIREYAVSIQSAGRTLLSLINSILDFSKIEDGKMEIIPVQYDTASMVHDLVATITPRIKEKGLEFKLEADDRLPMTLFGDDVRIRQIITNLLTNAVKYTEKGYVKLVIRPECFADDSIELYVEVTDSGIGIREEDLGKLAQSFQRLDEKRNRYIEGTGLGMTIVTRLLEMMNSKLEVASVYGKGSRFWFRVKQKITDPTPMGDYMKRLASENQNYGEHNILFAPEANVLVVDDNEMNLQVAFNLMKLYGFIPDTAASGKEAIERVRQKQYHIIFLDHMMPGMDGIETLQTLREEKLLENGTTVISLTANAIVGAREMYINAGFDDYLSKPIESRLLEKKLASYLPKSLVSYRENIPPEPSKAEEQADPDTFTAQELDKLWELCGALHALTGIHYCMGSKSFYLDSLQMYLDSDKHEELEQFLAAEDVENYRIAVHSLKSTSLTIGAVLLSDHAKALEMAAKAGDWEYIRSHHADVMTEYTAVTDGIHAILEEFAQPA